MDDRLQEASVAVVTEDFEDPDMELKTKLPDVANQWFGLLVSVAPKGGVSTVQESRVWQLSPNPGNRIESVRYVVDLDDSPELAQGHEQSLQVSAFFFAPFNKQEPKFRVELGAFREAPEDGRQECKEVRESGERVLQQVMRNHLPLADELGDWLEVRSSLVIPGGSRSVVISLGLFTSILTNRSLTSTSMRLRCGWWIRMSRRLDSFDSDQVLPVGGGLLLFRRDLHYQD